MISINFGFLNFKKLFIKFKNLINNNFIHNFSEINYISNMVKYLSSLNIKFDSIILLSFIPSGKHLYLFKYRS